MLLSLEHFLFANSSYQVVSTPTPNKQFELLDVPVFVLEVFDSRCTNCMPLVLVQNTIFLTFLQLQSQLHSKAKSTFQEFSLPLDIHNSS